MTLDSIDYRHVVDVYVGASDGTNLVRRLIDTANSSEKMVCTTVLVILQCLMNTRSFDATWSYLCQKDVMDRLGSIVRDYPRETAVFNVNHLFLYLQCLQYDFIDVIAPACYGALAVLVDRIPLWYLILLTLHEETGKRDMLLQLIDLHSQQWISILAVKSRIGSFSSFSPILIDTITEILKQQYLDILVESNFPCRFQKPSEFNPLALEVMLEMLDHDENSLIHTPSGKFYLMRAVDHVVATTLKDSSTLSVYSKFSSINSKISIGNVFINLQMLVCHSLQRDFSSDQFDIFPWWKPQIPPFPKLNYFYHDFSTPASLDPDLFLHSHDLLLGLMIKLQFLILHYLDGEILGLLANTNDELITRKVLTQFATRLLTSQCMVGTVINKAAKSPLPSSSLIHCLTWNYLEQIHNSLLKTPIPSLKMPDVILDFAQSVMHHDLRFATYFQELLPKLPSVSSESLTQFWCFNNQPLITIQHPLTSNDSWPEQTNYSNSSWSHIDEFGK